MRLRGPYRRAPGCLVDAGGVKIEVRNTHAFAAEHQLSRIMVQRLIRGEVKSYRGWRLEENQVDKTVSFRHTDGTERRVTSVADFARELGFQPQRLYDVSSGRRKSYKGWSLTRPVPAGKNRVRSPEGKIYTVKVLRAFAKEHDLDYANLRKVLVGKLKSHKGWSLAGRRVVKAPQALPFAPGSTKG